MAALPDRVKQSVIGNIQGQHPGVKVSVSFGRTRKATSPTGRAMLFCDKVTIKAKGYKDATKRLSWDIKDGGWRLV
jgi:hypothetical protein